LVSTFLHLCQIPLTKFSNGHVIAGSLEFRETVSPDRPLASSASLLKYHVSTGPVQHAVPGVYAAVPLHLNPKTYQPDRLLVASRMPAKKGRFRYVSAKRRPGTIQVDDNYMYRKPFIGTSVMNSVPLGGYTANKIPVVDLREIAAGKIIAMAARSASRDLYDAWRLLHGERLDWKQVKLATLAIGAATRELSRGNCMRRAGESANRALLLSVSCGLFQAAASPSRFRLPSSTRRTASRGRSGSLATIASWMATCSPCASTRSVSAWPRSCEQARWPRTDAAAGIS
jgi:Nucleotidyl transferase AbiEii toxin, Type IV TA system